MGCCVIASVRVVFRFRKAKSRSTKCCAHRTYGESETGQKPCLYGKLLHVTSCSKTQWCSLAVRVELMHESCTDHATTRRMGSCLRPCTCFQSAASCHVVHLDLVDAWGPSSFFMPIRRDLTIFDRSCSHQGKCHPWHQQISIFRGFILPILIV